MGRRVSLLDIRQRFGEARHLLRHSSTLKTEAVAGCSETMVPTASLQDVTSQKIVILLVTTVITSNLMQFFLVLSVHSQHINIVVDSQVTDTRSYMK